MHKFLNLLLFVFYTVTLFSQENILNQSGILKDLYRYNLKDSVKTVNYPRLQYREDLTLIERGNIDYTVISGRESYDILEFNKYGLLIKDRGDSIVYDEKDIQKKVNYNLKNVFPLFKRWSPDFYMLKANNVEWSLNACHFGNGQFFHKLLYKYNFDKNGKIKEVKKYYSSEDPNINKIIESDLLQTTKYIYDTKGNLTEQRIFKNDPDELNYIKKDGATEIYNYEYDDKNRLTRIYNGIRVFHGGMREVKFEEKYKYRPTENYISEMYIYDDSSVMQRRKILFYNKNGDITESNYLNNDLVVQKKIFYEYEYDSHNNWIKCKVRYDSMEDEIIMTAKRIISYYGN